jgi:hypothetical protein
MKAQYWFPSKLKLGSLTAIPPAEYALRLLTLHIRAAEKHPYREEVSCITGTLAHVPRNQTKY